MIPWVSNNQNTSNYQTIKLTNYQTIKLSNYQTIKILKISFFFKIIKHNIDIFIFLMTHLPHKIKNYLNCIIDEVK